MIADFDGDASVLVAERESGEYPILCTRNLVIFPTVLAPIIVGRPQSVQLAQKLIENPDKVFCIFCQKDEATENPTSGNLYKTGVFAKLIKTVELPGVESGNITIVVQALGRCRLEQITSTSPYYKGQVTSLPEKWPNLEDVHFQTLLDTLHQETTNFIHACDEMPNEAEYALNNISNPMIAANFICSNMPFSIEDKMEMLEKDNLSDRLYIALKAEHKELQLLSIQSDIKQKTRFDLDEQQREYFLQQQLKNIREELGGDEKNPEKKELAEKAKNKKWNEATAKAFNKELNKLETINPQSPDYAILVNYLQTMVDLPWNEYTQDNLSLKHAKKVLDKAHYGMEKVKERILEYLAVRSLRGDLKSPILCLYGPPGVGKTSLGKSIAEAMGRKYVRMSLGGLHDESEIRGHRRTYIGAMPGQIIKNIQKAGSSNPVFILDEIDKVTENTVNGDPSSALLEVLDPEQNSAFHDNFLDMDYDLSRVMFIATANNINAIPRPLLDRMELIEVGGYITEEKVEIARRHLLPKAKADMGLDADNSPKVGKEALEFIIERYTRESGVRGLEKQISKLLRKVALNVARGTDDQLPKTITPACVEKLLGNPPFNRDKYQGNRDAGVVTGLAWTSVGGEILFIETSLSQGKGGKLTLTGNLGDVMKESAMLALEYIKAHADLLGIDMRIFDNYNIHIHVPEGAVPKDGPSAGVTIATSIASALTQRMVRDKLAMTGEITLRGKVLPVGGIREKILAAKRAGITDIMLCQDNEKDILEIPEVYLKGLNFHYVNTVSDVWDFALLQEKVANPITFHLDDEKKEEKKA